MDVMVPIRTVIVTFFISLILNGLVNYYAGDRGAITLSDPLNIGGSEYYILTIDNYSSDIGSGISVSIPSSIALEHIYVSGALSIDLHKGAVNSSSNTIRIDQVAPRSVSRVIIPYLKTSSPIKITNSSSTGFSIKSETELRSPLVRALLSALVVATVYSILIGVATSYVRKSIARAEQTAHERIVSVEKKVERIEKESSNVRDRAAKARLLLMGRIRDYAKELTFWRTTIKSLLMHSGGDKKAAEDLFSFVTKQLKTYNARDDYFDFDALKIAAAWTREEGGK